MPTMKRCLAQLSIAVAGRPTEHLWPGLEVNVDRELAPGYTLGMAVEGYEHCFEDADPTRDEDLTTALAALDDGLALPARVDTVETPGARRKARPSAPSLRVEE